jgi:putative restriction endonuclease
MSVYFINTDAKSNNGHSYHKQWLKRGVAVTSGSKRFRDKLARPDPGDTLLIYANGLGIVGVGTVISGVFDTNDCVSPREPLEYHRQVDWHLDLISNPISPCTIRNLVGQTPLNTVQQVRNNLNKLQQHIAALA